MLLLLSLALATSASSSSSNGQDASSTDERSSGPSGVPVGPVVQPTVQPRRVKPQDNSITNPLYHITRALDNARGITRDQTQENTEEQQNTHDENARLQAENARLLAENARIQAEAEVEALRRQVEALQREAELEALRREAAKNANRAPPAPPAPRPEPVRRPAIPHSFREGDQVAFVREYDEIQTNWAESGGRARIVRLEMDPALDFGRVTLSHVGRRGDNYREYEMNAEHVNDFLRRSRAECRCRTCNPPRSHKKRGLVTASIFDNSEDWEYSD